LAAKQNVSASAIDKTSFWFAGTCGVCHPGGGFTEYDRDGQKYFDVRTGRYGYEVLGKSATDVALDGDYSEIATSGATMGALRNQVNGNDLWKRTGVAEPDCLFCHRADRALAVQNGQTSNMNWIWRSAALRGKDALVDEASQPVAAYAAAATAGQGWFKTLKLGAVPAGQLPLATQLDIDYQPGVTDGSLVADPVDGTLRIAPGAIATTPTDFACWGCHITPEVRKRGRVWFDPAKDVHYAGFNNLRNASTADDVAAAASTACSRCHPGAGGMNGEHNIAKGGTTLGTARDDTDYQGFRTCIQCHSGPTRDPQAPEPTSDIHTAYGHLDVLSCDACHIPYKSDAADMLVDNATSGSTILYTTARFLSEDPLNPFATGDARWYPDFKWKKDGDGVQRLFPMKTLLSMWWGDWDQRGTPTDRSDDVVVPLPLWRVRQAAKALPAGTVKDDNGDGIAEVNTLVEIQAWITALKGNDSHGNRFAALPVLVKGGAVWHEQGGGIARLEYEGTGMKVESEHPFAADHNVLPASEALGAGGFQGCVECHNTFDGETQSRVFDRKILKDPFDTDGQPKYRTVFDRVGLRAP